MNSLNEHFPFLGGHEVDNIYTSLTGRLPRHSQHMWIRNNGNDRWLTNGVCAFTPFDTDKKTLLVYACCHGAQLCEYWLNHSFTQHIRERYNIIFWQNYRAQGDAHYQPGQTHSVANLPEEYRELFIASFRSADVIVTHPAYGGTEFSPEFLMASYSNPDVHVIRFHSPSFGALWPVCLFGDDWAKDLLRSGVSAHSLKALIRTGETHACLTKRFEKAMDRLHAKDRLVDVGIEGFFSRHWRTHRMFVTFNHPSFHLMAAQAQAIEKAVVCADPGFFPWLSPDDEQACLRLPWNACNFQPVWPDHAIATRELGLRYSDSYPDTDHFYEKEIDRCASAVAAETTNQ